MINTTDYFTEFIDKNGIQCSPLSPEDKELKIDGLKKYLHSLVSHSKLCSINPRYLWHLFSYDCLPHQKQEDAINQYFNCYFNKYIIAPLNPNASGLICEGSKGPSYDLLLDILDSYPKLNEVYIFQQNFKWAFFVTHEQDFGPYFFKRNIL